jgi:hypothetical protein
MEAKQLPNGMYLDLHQVFERPSFADFESDWVGITNPQLPQVVLARVNPDGRIPSEPFTLNLQPGFSCLRLDYEWFIEYPFNGRNDRTPPVRGTVYNSTTFRVEFGDNPQGGIWRGTFGGIFRHTDGWQGPGTGLKLVSSIRGINPTKEQIRTRLASIPAQVRAYKESRFRQFGPDEMPLFGAPRGFGVMMIDNPPATARQIWSWLENVDAGLDLIDTKRRETTQHYKNIYAADPSIPHLTAEQFRLAEYQWYNGGWYWGWDAAARQWVKITPEPYADDAVRIENLVTQGTFPPEWK